MRSVYLPLATDSKDHPGETAVAATIERALPSTHAINEKLARKPGAGGMILFGLILAAGLFYVASHLISDLSVEQATSIRPYIMLVGALLIALGFEFGPILFQQIAQPRVFKCQVLAVNPDLRCFTHSVL